MSYYKTYEVKLDTMKEGLQGRINFKQSDKNTAKLIFHLKHDGAPMDLRGCEVRLALLKPDNSSVYQECIVTDAEKGIVEVILETQSLNVDGTVQAELSIYIDGDAVLTTTDFTFNVKKSILNDESFESVSEMPLVQKIIEAGEKLKNLDIDTLADIGGQFDQINVSLASCRDSIGNPDEFFRNQSSVIKKMKYEFYGRGVSMKSFGAHEDGINSDSQALVDAISSLNNKPGIIVFDGSKKYAFDSSVFIPYNIFLELNGCEIIPISGGSFTNNHLFHLNSRLSDGESAYDFGGYYTPVICNAIFRNPHDINVKIFLTRSRTNFFRLTFNGVYGAITKVGSANKDYTDSLRFDNIFCVNCRGTDWLIDLQYNGDATHFSSCHLAGDMETANPNMIRMRYCNGGSIDRLINGNVLIEMCQAVRVSNAHMEHGVFVVEASGASFKDIFHWAQPNKIPLTIKNNGGDKNSFPTTIENYCVQRPEFYMGYEQSYELNDDIDAVFQNANVSIKNFYRHIYKKSNPAIGAGTAAKISIDGSTVWDKWENYSQMYSKSCYIAGNTIKTEMSYNDICHIKAYGLTAAASNYRQSLFVANQTLHYKITTMYGYKDRLISRCSSVHTITIDADGGVVSFNLPQSEKYFGSILRIFRGESADSYTHYVDIPYIFGYPLQDYGSYLATGERWKTIGDKEVELFNSQFESYEISGMDNIIMYGTSSPLCGTWKKRDRVINTNIAPGQPQGWICSTDGTPGTWITLPNY